MLGIELRLPRWRLATRHLASVPTTAVVTLLVTLLASATRLPPVVLGHHEPKRRQGPGHVREILTTKIRLGALEDLPRHGLEEGVVVLVGPPQTRIRYWSSSWP